MCVKYYDECWKRQCVVLNDPAVQRKFFQENLVEIKEDTNKGYV